MILKNTSSHIVSKTKPGCTHLTYITYIYIHMWKKFMCIKKWQSSCTIGSTYLKYISYLPWMHHGNITCTNWVKYQASCSNIWPHAGFKNSMPCFCTKIPRVLAAPCHLFFHSETSNRNPWVLLDDDPLFRTNNTTLTIICFTWNKGRPCKVFPS